MKRNQLTFATLLVVVGIFALAGSSVSAQNVQQFITSTTSTTVSSYTSTITSLSTTVITGISYTTQTFTGTFTQSTTTQTVSITTSAFATLTQAVAVTSTSTIQVLSQLVSVSSGSIVTVTSDPTLLLILFGILVSIAFIACVGVWVTKQPLRPVVPQPQYAQNQPVQYVQPALPRPPQPNQVQWNGAWYRFNPSTGMWDLLSR